MPTQKPDQSHGASVKFIARRVAPAAESHFDAHEANLASQSNRGTALIPDFSGPEDSHDELAFSYNDDPGRPTFDFQEQDTHMQDVSQDAPDFNRKQTTRRSALEGSYRDKANLQHTLHKTTAGVVKPRQTKVTRGTQHRALQRVLSGPSAPLAREPESMSLSRRKAPSLLETESNASGVSSISSGAFSEVSAEPDPLETNADLDGAEVEVLLQPQTRPITSDQLLLEVQTIYDGVVRIEERAIAEDYVQTQAAQVDPNHRRPLSKEEYQSYIGLHKALIHEHHDLCLATQHPAATSRLRQLPAKYSTPARMWRHGVHAPLELLRLRLPESREHMVAFILISFNHMTLFLETVRQFEATWLECIGDLGRYRLALAENDEEREIFSGIARYWYCRAIQMNPHIARLYHHCAILAPPFSLEQLSLYGRSLTGIIPFLPARKSILALFRPIVSRDETLARQLSPITLTILRAHATVAIGGRGSRAIFNQCLAQLSNGVFDGLWAEAEQRQLDKKKLASHLAIANSALILQYGTTRGNGTSGSMVRLSLDAHAHPTSGIESAYGRAPTGMVQSTIFSSFTAVEMSCSKVTVKAACKLTFGIFAEALRKPKDEDLHPMVHICFIVVWSLTRTAKAVHEVVTQIPWRDIASFLNIYANAASMSGDICSPEFPVNAGGRHPPLPEDFLLKGMIFAKVYFPQGWTEDCSLDLAEQGIEKPFMTATRIQRMLWAGHQIAQQQKYLFYDEDTRRFNAGFGMEALELTADESDFVPLLPDTEPQ